MRKEGRIMLAQEHFYGGRYKLKMQNVLISEAYTINALALFTKTNK